MLSYRHGFHAGNHADVLKHVCLVNSYKILKRMYNSINYIDTHSGNGLYFYNNEYMAKNREYIHGIEKIIKSNSSNSLINYYLKTIRNINKSKKLSFYPGSPVIMSHLSNNNDKLFFYELHNNEIKTLKKNLSNYTNLKIYHTNGFNFFKKKINFKNKYLVLIDPSYELESDYVEVINFLKMIDERFKNFTILIWYPIIDINNHTIFIEKIKKLAISNLIRIELPIENYSEEIGLKGSGIFIVNSNKKIISNLKNTVYELYEHLKNKNCKIKPVFRYLK